MWHWRELAWHFCHHTRDVDSTAAIPGWARETLERHREDERERTLSWAELFHAEAGDSLWDAMQRSLLRHGELHNNLRMTWGKAVLGWTPDGETALAHLLDLNHRLALDGRDPSSYGGILWCLGQFDRPFEPEERVIGTVTTSAPGPTPTNSTWLPLRVPTRTARSVSVSSFLKVLGSTTSPRRTPAVSVRTASKETGAPKATLS